ncbi:hypothetical protein [Dulcicalothrix desertica]|nr:hypothetical protein [Dulcicalothrix desertica]
MAPSCSSRQASAQPNSLFALRERLPKNFSCSFNRYRRHIKQAP